MYRVFSARQEIYIFLQLKDLMNKPFICRDFAITSFSDFDAVAIKLDVIQGVNGKNDELNHCNPFEAF